MEKYVRESLSRVGIAFVAIAILLMGPVSVANAAEVGGPNPGNLHLTVGGHLKVGDVATGKPIIYGFVNWSGYAVACLDLNKVDSSYKVDTSWAAPADSGFGSAGNSCASTSNNDGYHKFPSGGNYTDSEKLPNLGDGDYIISWIVDPVIQVTCASAGIAGMPTCMTLQKEGSPKELYIHLEIANGLVTDLHTAQYLVGKSSNFS